MNSASAAKPVHRSWLVLAAKAVVVMQLLAIVYTLTSVWIAVAVAAAFAVVVAAVRALGRASKQVDRIFEEELG
ncbi:hypothetical protein [Nocardia sp. NRRL S-836]|uniref:hypothetical protein n=1 Tax=Nocardia sp. NRRL S-836 TaxID=1519492 RepID=UPI0006AFC324|nr:hypothetical protein [Nocardia sp. NRRL S-836]KOV80543.1 hypothetical protein ADL03_32595 [Nocardia sp. NRRL S-836]